MCYWRRKHNMENFFFDVQVLSLLKNSSVRHENIFDRKVSRTLFNICVYVFPYDLKICFHSTSICWPSCLCSRVGAYVTGLKYIPIRENSRYFYSSLCPQTLTQYFTQPGSSIKLLHWVKLSVFYTCFLILLKGIYSNVSSL